MNIRQIKELAQIVRENGLSALEVSENESKIRIECEQKKEQNCAAPGTGIQAPQAVTITEQVQDPVDFNRTSEIRSPIVGVFYAAPSPEAEPFVKVGDRVKKGDVVCIVEAMKLMNEITAEFDGEVVDVCVRSGDVVEYGQTLFKLC